MYYLVPQKLKMSAIPQKIKKFKLKMYRNETPNICARTTTN